MLPSIDPSPSFTDTLDSLLLLTEKVFQHNIEGELILGSNKSNGITAGFIGYRELYNMNRSGKGHIEKFKEIYTKCRPLFLKDMKTLEFMDWFRDKSSFVISPQEKSIRKLYITVIFRKCCNIAKHIAEEADRHPEKAEQLLGDPSAVFPEHFMLCLFRLFYHCADEIDRRIMILPRIKEIEMMVSVAAGQTPPVGDGVSDLFKSMTQMAKDVGLPVPENAPSVTGDQFRDALNQMTNNQEAKEMMKGLFAGVKDAKDVPTAISQLFSKMQATANQVPEPVQRSLEATADSSEDKM